MRKIYGNLFLFLVVILLVLPFLITFNEVLTRLIEKISLYRALQAYVVPFQVKLVSLLASLLGVRILPTPDGMIVNNTALTITWNCIGWQSLLIFAISLLSLNGTSFSTFSRLKAILVGFAGIFWINIFRMTFVVFLSSFSVPVFRIVFHDYLAAIITIVFLFFFWWFSYSFVLETKETDYTDKS